MNGENIKDLVNKIKDERDSKLANNYADRKYNEGYSAGYDRGTYDALNIIRKHFEVQADE